MLSSLGAPFDLLIVLILALGAFTDLKERLIPNSVAACTAVTAIAKWAVTEPMQIAISLLIAALLLAAGLFLFLRGYMGGGDAKLIPAASLMFRPEGVPLFLLAMSLIGATIAVAFMIAKKTNSCSDQSGPPSGNMVFDPLRLSHQLNQGIPYAVAICLGAIAVKIGGYE